MVPRPYRTHRTYRTYRTDRVHGSLKPGIQLARPSGVGVQKLDDLIAWQVAQEFKLEVYRLLREHSAAHEDVRFRSQLRESAASVGVNIGEGFHRYGAREFSRYLSIAIASLAEAVLWLRDGVDREHYTTSDCAHALTLAKRCKIASLRLKHSLDEITRRG